MYTIMQLEFGLQLMVNDGDGTFSHGKDFNYPSIATSDVGIYKIDMLERTELPFTTTNNVTLCGVFNLLGDYCEERA